MIPSLPTATTLSRLVPLVFTGSLLLFVLFQTLTTHDDPYRCKALIGKGSWLNAPDEHGTRKPFDSWQPDGCMLRKYTPEDIKTCIGDRRAVFSGDSTTRQIFWGMARLLDRELALALHETADIHQDYNQTFADVRLIHVWNPFLRTGEGRMRLTNQLSAFAQEELEPEVEHELQAPALTMIGFGSWFALKQFENESIANFQEAYDKALGFAQLDKMPRFGESPMRPGEGVGNEIFVAPVAPPYYEDLPRARTGPKGLQPGEVESMDDYMYDSEEENHARLLRSFVDLSKDQPFALVDRTQTGFHVIDSVAEIKATILLNARCNAKLDEQDGYPYNRTCCTDYGGRSFIQTMILAITTLYVLACVSLETLELWKGDKPRSSVFNIKIGMFAVSLLFCYAADRTQMFAKGSKEFVLSEFTILCFVTALIGFATIRKGKGRAASNTETAIMRAPGADDLGIMSRDQTEEWKGWMQAAILLYHWTGASKHLPTYMFIRLLVAAYLFQIGYGHTVYFLAKKDFSFRRVAAVMLRLNLLSCALPYVMGNNYMFYYFAPLASFWFLIVYMTMVFLPSFNNDGRVLIKIAGSCAILYGFSNYTPWWDGVFTILEYVFNIQWDLHEWVFRVNLDTFIVFFGMLAGVAHQRIQREASWLTSYKTYIVPSIFCIGAYAWLCEYHLDFKADYNWWHPYTSFMPIIAFVILRNSTTALRNHCSLAAAWLGRCSLETFILQYHLFLAADTKGLLLLDIFRGGDGSLLLDRWRDLAVIIPVFLWISNCVSEATGALVKVLMDLSKRSGPGERDPENVELGNYSLISDGEKRYNSSPFSRVLGAMSGDLRTHMAILLGSMWILNWVY